VSHVTSKSLNKYQPCIRMLSTYGGSLTNLCCVSLRHPAFRPGGRALLSARHWRFVQTLRIASRDVPLQDPAHHTISSMSMSKQTRSVLQSGSIEKSTRLQDSRRRERERSSITL